MPNKTIYVSDEDLPLFERAQQLTGLTLSPAIVRALRRLIELEEAKQGGLEEITVVVNSRGVPDRKRFVGQRIVRWLQPTKNDKGTEILNVYRTAGNRYALHTRSIPEWPMSAGDPEYVGNPKNWGVGDGFLKQLLSWGHDWETFQKSGNFSLQVFENLDELKAHVPNDLYKAVVQATEEPDSEYLDI